MKRRLLNLLTALSLLLCVAVVALWVRSYWSTDTWAWFKLDLGAARATEFRVRSKHGSLHFSKLTLIVAPAFYSTPAATKRLKEMEGLSHSSRRGDYDGRQLIRLPHWILLPPLAVLPVLWARRRQADRHRATSVQCQNCGYDLRATPDRCPECGVLTTDAAPISGKP